MEKKIIVMKTYKWKAQENDLAIFGSLTIPWNGSFNIGAWKKYFLLPFVITSPIKNFILI